MRVDDDRFSRAGTWSACGCVDVRESEQTKSLPKRVCALEQRATHIIITMVVVV